MISRRALLASAPILLGSATGGASRPGAGHAAFAAAALRMRDEAVAAGDQAYGAVVVLDGQIVGYGPSRVVVERNPDAHAERVALRNAQHHLGRSDLAGAVIYASSRPCSICQRALAAALIGRMYVGREADDGGPPRGE